MCFIHVSFYKYTTTIQNDTSSATNFVRGIYEAAIRNLLILPARLYAIAILLLAMALTCVSVCVSITSPSSIKIAVRIELIFSQMLPLTCPTVHCAVSKFGISKNNGTLFIPFIPDSGVRKFRHGTQVLSSAVNLVRQHLSLSVFDRWLTPVYHTARLWTVSYNTMRARQHVARVHLRHSQRVL